MKRTNRNVVNEFVRGRDFKVTNLKSENGKLISYNTTIAQHVGDTLIVNITKYSSTTTRQLSYLKSQLGGKVEFVDNVKINTYDLRDKERVAYEDLPKSWK